MSSATSAEVVHYCNVLNWVPGEPPRLEVLLMRRDERYLRDRTMPSVLSLASP